MAISGRKRKILVVEADTEFRSMLADFLSAQKFVVEVAGRGDEGIEKYNGFQPDIVLLSRELPKPDGKAGPDGLRVLKVIKQNRKGRRTPVILASGEVGESDFDRYRKLNFTADDYITKPFEDTEILRRIENLVGFDLSDKEQITSIKESIDEAMDPAFESIFDADENELGPSASAQTRKEVASLLEQVGRELEMGDEVSADDQSEEKPSKKSKQSQEVQNLTRQLEKVQKQLKNERQKSREIKKEWREKLKKIESRLQQSEKRELAMRHEFEKMRGKYADLELEHTMEIERIQSENRLLEEEILKVKELGDDSFLRELAADLKKAVNSINKIIKALEGQG